nr:MAG TPA: hypothetical protein [Caudoviricetes sp.]
MKFLTKIQSVSDIITNSSSETFIMTKGDAEYYDNLDTGGCVSIYELTKENIENNFYDVELICDYLDLDLDGADLWNSDDCKAALELYVYPNLDKLEGLYVVDIEDHFADAYDVLCDARSDALAQEYRH